MRSKKQISSIHDAINANTKITQILINECIPWRDLIIQVPEPELFYVGKFGSLKRALMRRCRHEDKVSQFLASSQVFPFSRMNRLSTPEGFTRQNRNIPF